MEMTKHGNADNTRIGLGIALMVVSIGLFITMDALIKHLSLQGYGTIQIMFFRSVFAFIPIALLVMRMGGLAALATKRPIGHLARALIGLVAMASFFYAYKTLPLSDAIAISFAAPLFMTAMSVPMLGESVGIRRWLAVLIGFAGVLVMVQPSTNMELGAIVVLCGTVFYALAMIMVRKLSATETSVSIVFYFTVAGSVISGVAMFWLWEQPLPGDWWLLISVGVLGGIAQLVMTAAIRAAPIAILAPFEYTALLWGAGFDILIWGLFPTANTLWGAAVVVATGLYIVHRETRLGVRARFPARFSRIRVSMGEREPDETDV